MSERSTSELRPAQREKETQGEKEKEEEEEEEERGTDTEGRTQYFRLKSNLVGKWMKTEHWQICLRANPVSWLQLSKCGDAELVLD